MVMALRPEAKPGTSLRSLVNGFVLTKQTEGKSPRTVEFYSENLKRFLWYVQKQDWPDDDIRLLTEWHIRLFLGYVGSETCRWGIQGNGSETSSRKASQSTVWHYFVVLSCFFNWSLAEGFIQDNPMSKIKAKKPKAKVIKPYEYEEIKKMLVVSDYDYEHNAKLLGSRNRALILVLLDTGVDLPP